MRILQLAPPWFSVPPARYGGAELVVAGLADGLVADGHRVTLLASGGSDTRAQLRTVYGRPPTEALGDAATELAHVLAGYRHRQDYDVIHDHTVTGAAVAALSEGPPVVHTVHGDWTPALARLYPMIADRVHLVAISHDHAARAPAGVPLAGVVHNGIDVDRYPFRPHGEGYLGWVGRAGPDKGADVAIEVARRLGRPLRMAIKVNEADERRWWTRVLKPRLGDADVEVVHNATNAQKVALLGGASVVLFPIRWAEPFGLVMVEANACGTPVVAFARGAAPEVLEDGTTGVLVGPDDIDGLCAAVDVAEKLDRADCRAHVRQHFSVTAMVDGYLAIYRRLVQDPAAAPLAAAGLAGA